MNAKLAELARRRESLISQSAGQREQLSQAYQRLLSSIQFVKIALGAIRVIKAHPAAVMGLTALLAGTRWTKFPRLGRWLWMGWTILKPFQAWRSRRRA